MVGYVAGDAGVAELHEFSLPFLVLHGEADKVCDIAGSRNLMDKASSTDKQIMYVCVLQECAVPPSSAVHARLFRLLGSCVCLRALTRPPVCVCICVCVCVAAHTPTCSTKYSTSRATNASCAM